MEEIWRVNSTLPVENISAADGGNYTCIAENEAGTVESTASLSVRLYTNESLVLPILTTTNGTVESLTCPIEGFPVSYVWQRGMEVSDSGDMMSGNGSGNSSDTGSTNDTMSGSEPMESGSSSGLMQSGSSSGLTPDSSGQSNESSGSSGMPAESGGGSELVFTTISTGRILEFNPVVFGDEGMYRCVATSDSLGETEVSAPTTVTSEYPPHTSHVLHFIQFLC